MGGDEDSTLPSIGGKGMGGEYGEKENDDYHGGGGGGGGHGGGGGGGGNHGGHGGAGGGHQSHGTGGSHRSHGSQHSVGGSGYHHGEASGTGGASVGGVSGKGKHSTSLPMVMGGRAGASDDDYEGRAVQVDHIKPQLKPPVSKSLKLKFDKLLSNVAMKFNLRRYRTGAATCLRSVAA